MSDDHSPASPTAEQPESSSASEIIVAPPRFAIRVRWAETIFAMSLIVCAVLAVLAHRYAYFNWDLALASRIQNISLPGFDGLMLFVSKLGSGWLPWALVVTVGALLIRTGFKVEGIVTLAGVGLGWPVNQLLKSVIARPRPSDALVRVTSKFSFDSFPSGHVVFFVEFFGFLLFLAFVLLKPRPLRRAAITALGLLIALVGVSRVYLGAHWPSDVIGAYLAGGIWLMLMIELYRRAKSKQA